MADIIAGLVVEHGYAELRDVPDDQQPALRKDVRSLVRQRTGHGSQTLVHDSMIVFVCKAIWEQRAAEQQRAAMEAMNRFLSGETMSTVQPEWRVSWDAWGAG